MVYIIIQVVKERDDSLSWLKSELEVVFFYFFLTPPEDCTTLNTHCVLRCQQVTPGSQIMNPLRVKDELTEEAGRKVNWC